MRKADELAVAAVARCKRRLKANETELKQVRRQFGTAIVRLVNVDPEFAASLQALLKAREKSLH